MPLHPAFRYGASPGSVQRVRREFLAAGGQEHRDGERSRGVRRTYLRHGQIGR